MNITEMINQLEELRERYGDLPCYSKLFAASDFDKRDKIKLLPRRNDKDEVYELIIR